MTSGVAMSFARPLSEIPFSTFSLTVGERLTYDVSFGGIAAGHQSLEVAAHLIRHGEEVYELRSEAFPSSLFLKIYPFKDSKQSLISTKTLLPLRYEKEIEDRRYRAKFVVEFDRGRHRAIVWRDGIRQRREPLMPQDVLDELSMVYYLRAKNLIPGNRYEYTFFTGTRLYNVTVEALRYEYYNAPPPLGRVKVLRLRASDGFSAWITADAFRIPVRIEAPSRVSVKLTATLRAWSGIQGLPLSP